MVGLEPGNYSEASNKQMVGNGSAWSWGDTLIFGRGLSETKNHIRQIMGSNPILHGTLCDVELDCYAI